MNTPHPVLAEYYAREQQREGFVRGIFDRTASDYDALERLLSLGTGVRYRRDALRRAGLSAGMRVLDVATGTGLAARQAKELAGGDGTVVGIDASHGMLRYASQADPIALIQGSAERLPFADACFDFLCLGFALRHLGSLERAFVEFRRVLRPAGTVCILEITLPEKAWLRRLLKAYLRGVGPLASRLVAHNPETPKLWRYYWDTIEACVPPAQVISSLRSAGLSEAHRHVELGCFSEYVAQR